jgi:hypothetical protein
VNSVWKIPMTVTRILYITPGTILQDGVNVARFRTDRLAWVDAAGNLQTPDAEQQTHIKLRLTTAFGDPGNEDTRIKDFRRCLTDVKTIVDSFTAALV